MSMLRCLFGRVQLVKRALGEAGTSSVCLKVTHRGAQSTSQYIINLPARMTFPEKKSASPRVTSTEVQKTSSFIRNGFIDTTQRNSSLSSSEGYYSSGSGQQARNNQKSQTNEKKNTKCEFNFNSINIRLLETFGIIGTAVAVGINVNSRINEWLPYQNRRGIHDFCQYHHHHLKSSPSGPASNGTLASPPPPSSQGVLDCFHKSAPSTACSENGPQCLSTIHYCGSCIICRGLFERLLRVYVFPSQFSSNSIASSILSILPTKSSALPTVGYNHTDSTRENDQAYVDEVDGPPLPTGQAGSSGLLYLDSGNASSRQRISSEDEEQQKQKQKPPTRSKDESSSRQRKKSIYFISEKENKQLKSIVSKASSKSDYISLTESSRQSSPLTSSIDSAKSSHLEHDLPSTSAKAASTVASPSKKSSPDDGEDLATVFRMASIEYADQLNNLMGLSLMENNQPEQAMQCWSSCEASSQAFFNMGVAYESGRYAKNASPDYERSHDCFAIAASLGHASAIYNLSLFYLYGKGKCAEDIPRGLELLQEAASRGISSAADFLAELKREQMLDEIRESLQRKPSNVDVIKRRPLRTSIRPTASMFGSTSYRLKPKNSSEARESATSTLRRNHSMPELHATPFALATTP